MANTPESLQIELMSDPPEAIPLLQECFEQERVPYYGPDGPGNAYEDLQDSRRRDEPQFVYVLWLTFCKAGY